MMQPGIVYLIGAGPGDPDLITVKGLKCLQQADVVVYDRLVNQQLLLEAPSYAQLLYVGKVPEQPSISQEEINAILIREAQQGKRVVRLKGGDPFVFGRGGEECQALAQAHIPFEVVPGISSALCVPAYAGIPVTQRQMATSFTVITGHTAGRDAYAVEWARLPQKGTLVILMGMRHLGQIAADLIQHGRAATTPVAVIQQGTTPNQLSVTGTLADIADKAQGIKPPAIIIVGEVVDLHQQIDWFNPTAQRGPVLPLLPTAVSASTEWSHHA